MPVGRTIDVLPGANLLDVLRAHDVPISYSCIAGRCQTCRCTVMSGSVLESVNGMPAELRREGDNVLACQTVLPHECVIELPDADEVVVHPARIVKAQVTAIENLTHDIKGVRLRTARPLAFSPGQYATLQFTPHHSRPYSMASLPGDEEMEFHIRIVPGGHVSGYVATSLRIGDHVRVSGPLGTSFLRRKHTGPVLFIAGGTGLAPVISILRGMREGGMRNPVDLYFGVRSPRDVYGQALLQSLAAGDPGLRIHVVATSAADSGLRTGVVTEAVARDFSCLEGWHAYVCGAPPMVDAARAVLRTRGIPDRHVHADAFYASAG